MTEVTNNELADALLVLEAKDAATLVILRLAADRLRSAPSVSDSAGWIGWNGGKCPVDLNTPVEVRYRSGGDFPPRFNTAGNYAWGHDGNYDDIVAYRIPK